MDGPVRGAARWRRLFVVGALTTISFGLFHVAGAAPLNGLIIGVGPVSMTKTNDKWTASVPVSNPTTDAITVSAAPLGSGDVQNECEVAVDRGARVESGTSATLSISVATARDCPEPDDGSHRVVLTAQSERGAPQVVVISIAKAAAENAEPKPTALTLPTETVFLRHLGNELVGSLDVVNNTSAEVVVTPSAVDPKTCAVIPAKPAPSDGTKDAGRRIAPGGSKSITIRVPAGCKRFDAEQVELSVLTSNVDATKYEYGTITLEAEVDWSATHDTVILILIGGFGVAVAGGIHGIGRASRRSPRPSRRLKWTDPLVAGVDAPKSWLTAIATIGPLATALFSTTNLVEGLTGHAPTAPKTLVLVAAAVALVLVGIATTIANIPARVMVGEDGKNQDCPLVWHFVLAAGLTTCSAGIALAAVWGAATALDLPGGHNWIAASAIVLAVALALYAFWAVQRFIERFAQVSPPAATPTPIPTDLLAGTLRSLAPNFIGSAQLTDMDPRAQARWLGASKTAASAMVKLLETPDTPRTVERAVRRSFTRSMI